ncbi:MAG: hypothetical protein AB7H80_15320 [Candidatus Kapaibacterium sp.]
MLRFQKAAGKTPASARYFPTRKDVAYAESFPNDTGGGVTIQGKNLCLGGGMFEHLPTFDRDSFLPRLEGGEAMASLSFTAQK